jgi:hypothetical protein
MYRIILFLLLGAASAQAGSMRLAALGMVESGDDDGAVGAVGEVSRYQIKPWIWRQYSQSRDYKSPAIASFVAGRHLAELDRIFRKQTNRVPDDFDLYVLWNAGPTYYGRIGFNKTRVNAIVRDRAQRYANLREAMEVKLAKAQPSRNPAPLRPARTASSGHPSPAPVPASPAKPGSLLPLLEVPVTPSLQSPMFSVLPLTAHPPAPMVDQRPIFAIGGLKPR